jgi:hypothetical protein
LAAQSSCRALRGLPVVFHS